MEFSDGMKFNLDTTLHAERRSDGWYVVGNGMLCAVRSEAAAIAAIGRINARKKANSGS